MSAIRIATLSLPAIILLLPAVAESSKLASAASMAIRPPAAGGRNPRAPCWRRRWSAVGHMDVLPASALLFAGLTSVALSPAVVLLATVVLHHNDLILLAIGSAFVWLLAITVCASSWWATASLGDGSRLVLAVLVGAPVQEASRWLTYALYLRLLRGLHSGVGPLPPAVVSLHAMAPAAVANGVGIGLMQTLVMFGDTATRSLLPGSLYTDACTSLSLFAVNALCALGTRSRLETAPAPGRPQHPIAR